MFVRHFTIAIAITIGASLSCSAATPVPPTSDVKERFTNYFAGTWKCAGEFPASGRKISSTIHFDNDLADTAVVKHHNDALPGMYHALEIWTARPDHGGYVATITDSLGGIRTFTSTGWQSDTLAWRSDATVKLKQEFVYIKKSADEFQLDWRRASDGTT